MAESSPDYDYPKEPPPCLSTGAECRKCPYLPDCGYQEVGIIATSTAALLTETQTALQNEQVENRQYRYDDVVPGFLTWKGMQHLIRQDATFRRELQHGDWGALFCDVRGLKSTNDQYGRPNGDNLLRLAGTRFIVEAGVRMQDREVLVNQRRVPNLKDIGIRDRSSDELMAIVRRVTIEEFNNAVLPRQYERFSPRRAVEDSKEGRVPTVLGCAGVHASELDPYSLAYPYDALRAAFELADTRQLQQKPAQYQEMFLLAAEAARAQNVTLSEPGDERAKAGLFFKWCCPDYFANAAELLAAKNLK